MFKVGDRVRCVSISELNVFARDYVERGEVYVISDISLKSRSIALEGCPFWCATSCFESIDSTNDAWERAMKIV